MSKRRHNWKDGIVNALELPRDLAYQESVVTLIGHQQLRVENYRHILRYTNEMIVISISNGKLYIWGKYLEIPCYNNDEMWITGCLTGISFQDRTEV